MLRSTLTVLGTALAIAFMATPSMAQTVCGKRADIVNRLRTGLDEQARSAGLEADGNLVEVFASKNGTRTIIYTKSGGLSCLVDVGDNCQQIEAPVNATGKML